MSKYTVTKIWVYGNERSSRYELWGKSPNDTGMVYLGSNDFTYPTKEEAREAAFRHAMEYPDIYQLSPELEAEFKKSTHTMNHLSQPNRRRPAPYTRPAPKYGRNERCLCGSGKKFKACCLGKTEEEIADKAFKRAESSTKYPNQ